MHFVLEKKLCAHFLLKKAQFRKPISLSSCQFISSRLSLYNDYALNLHKKVCAFKIKGIAAKYFNVGPFSY